MAGINSNPKMTKNGQKITKNSHVSTIKQFFDPKTQKPPKTLTVASK